MQMVGIEVVEENKRLIEKLIDKEQEIKTLKTEIEKYKEEQERWLKLKVAIQNYLLTLGYCQIPTHKSIDGVEVTLTQKFMETHIRAIVNVPLDYANKNIKLEE